MTDSKDPVTPTLTDLLDERPVTFRNFEGYQETINWPDGLALARCGDVWLIRCRNSFAVVYGLQVDVPLDLTAAVNRFGWCCIHQADCLGRTH